MRLPMKSPTEVDRDATIPMLRRAFELGINIYDTAAGYCGGDSQRVLGEALQDVRDKVVLSTKNPHYNKADKAGWWRNLQVSLERLRADHIDIYNHHGINYDIFEQNLGGPGGIYEEMLKAREQGLIRHIGFSFHAPPDHLVKLVDTGLYDTVILQYNLLYRELEEAIAYAAGRGMGIIVMGPVGGGCLGYPNERAASLVGDVKSTPDLALRFVLSNKNVHVALSGMNAMKQLEENVETVSRAGEFTEQDHRRISAAIEERKKLCGLYCTGCRYCMPCPAGVDIPANFEILNLERVFGLTEHARQRYAHLGGKAALCRLCGKCLEPCPQKLDVPTRLGEAIQALDERAGSVIAWTELRGASLAGDTLSLKLRCLVKNLSDKARKVSVEMLPSGEDQVWPQKFRFAKMPAYGRRQKDLQVTLGRAADAYHLDAIIRHDASELVEHLSDTVLPARRAEGYVLDASERRPGTIHVPAAGHPALAGEQPAKEHCFDFSVAYDGENLYVYADVEDDLSGVPQIPGQSPHRSNHLRIYLDARTPYMIGRGGYDSGVTHVTLAPSATAGRTAGELAVSARGEFEVRSAWRRTPTGYRVDCAIPWRAFAQVPAPPAVTGFDIAMRRYDAQGRQTLHLNWTGRAHGDRTPSAFGKLVLV